MVGKIYIASNVYLNLFDLVFYFLIIITFSIECVCLVSLGSHH